jgi:hypothetical protein
MRRKGLASSRHTFGNQNQGEEQERNIDVDLGFQEGGFIPL